MAVESARRKRHTQFLLGGILPIDRKRIPVDVIAGATLAALAIPEVMGYAKIAGTPGDHRAVHADPADRPVRAVRLVAPPGGGRRLGDRAPSSRSACSRLGAVSGSPEYVAAGLAWRP